MGNQKEKIVYRNIDEALSDLNAKDRGRYFLCVCPECKQQEAFIYKNNMNYIQCNRESECGERMLLCFEEKDSVLSLQEQEDYPNLTKEQLSGLKMVTRYTEYMQKNIVSPLDDGYRGLSRETTEPFVADFIAPSNVKKLFEYGRTLFPKNYAESDWMCKRNLVFPIYGEDGLVERILLRSSIDPTIEPKEIQLIVNPSKETRDFFVDIPSGAETIVLSEAILDAASFREIDKSIGIIGLTGAAKTRKIMRYIEDNKSQFANNNFLLALDNDEAGWKATRSIMTELDRLKMEYQLFPLPQSINDPNAFLQVNPKGFSRVYEQVTSSFGEKPRLLKDRAWLER